MSSPQLIVQKYGGATLATPEKIKQVALRIAALHKTNTKVVVIVSAMGQTTNQLIELANQVSKRPPLRELDMLLTVGERISMSLLSMALNDLGCSAISFTGSQAGILTDDSHINANILDVKAFRVDEALKENKIVILAGFQGVSQKTKEITTLGRGGSDITAVAMAGYLKADRCEILKDVAGVYSADPKLVESAQVIPELNYSHLLEMTSWGAKVLHHTSVSLAAEKKVPLFIGSASEPDANGTLVSNNTNFDDLNILGVNSFSEIFSLELNEHSENLDLFLQKNQIGQIRILHENKNRIFVTAPHENLVMLKNFEKQQSLYKITDDQISSLTLTSSIPLQSNEILKFKKILIENQIDILANLTTKYSLHFFVSSSQRNQAIQLLHRIAK